MDRYPNHSEINRLAFIDNDSPPQCANAALTTDLCNAIAAEGRRTTALPVQFVPVENEL